MSEALAGLKTRMTKIARLSEAAALVDWDQQTYMPHGAA